MCLVRSIPPYDYRGDRCLHHQDKRTETLWLESELTKDNHGYRSNAATPSVNHFWLRPYSTGLNRLEPGTRCERCERLHRSGCEGKRNSTKAYPAAPRIHKGRPK